jgi:M6 family metalloprotease-like protein
MINKSRGAAFIAFALFLSLIPFSANSNSHGAGPQGPPCGIYKVKKDEVIAGVKFPKGSYQINAFGISCSKVLGSKGLFAKFLKLKDKDPLPKPWKYLSDAVGAPKFSSGPGVGFRVQSISQSRPTPTPTPSPSPTPTSSATPSTSPSPTATPTPVIQVSNLSAYLPVSECKLINKSSNNDVNLSHAPRTWYLVDTTKTIRGLIFPVDFPDHVSRDQNSPSFKELISSFEEFYTSQSNGKIKFTWTVSPRFSRISKTIDSYGIGSRGAGSNAWWLLNNDIQDLAFQTYKREDFDMVIGSAPTSTSREQIASSPAFGTSDLRYKPATYLGGDYWSNGSSWTIPTHEFGHFALGIADLYDYKSSMLGQAGFEAQFQYMGVYDLMNWAGGAGVELTSWSRWIAKLISDSQMLCLPSTETVTLLKPIEELSDEVKGLVVPISNSVAIVIENRAALGFDKGLTPGAQGVIAYVVDTSIDSGAGPMRLIRKAGSTDNLFRDNALKVGESITHLGYSIKVIGQSGKNMYVQVKKET